ncbi:MAG: F0F1 ATP synthase subunit epsilon [Acidobacteriia bacterium]|nr:F0F1 ATP synthase subunit epsilon [Terriglobia bacterium]
MPELIELEVATPERQLVHEDVAEVQVPGKDGELGILPGHAPLLSELGCGTLSYPVAGRRRYLAILGGFLEVLPGHIRVLADAAERAEEIDLERARADLRRAEEQLASQAPDADPAASLAAMERAQARVLAAEQR